MTLETHHLRKGWYFLFAVFLLLLPALTPPHWLLRVTALEMNRTEETLTFSREAASVANLFERCRIPNTRDDVDWCRGVDNAFPLTWAEWRTDALLPGDPPLECTETGFSRYQWEPTSQISYPSRTIGRCFGDGRTTLRTVRRFWLFGIIPTAFRQVSTHNFEPLPVAVLPIQSEVQMLRDQVRELQAQIAQLEAQ